jgi:hypothetical protein
MGGSRNSFHPIPQWVFGEGGGGGGGEEKKGKRERLWEIKHIFFALLFTACCMKLLRCYLHNPQIAFLILKRFFRWVYGILGSSIFT